ncbi:MAG: hypothetical protein QXG39_09495 [Candidatus Aenigmatarchaeota archaeon]
MVRKVVIEAVLVPELAGKYPRVIEGEILREIRCGALVIPWCAKIEKVVVVEGQ